MAISFSTIPSDLNVPLFYAELDNSMANTASTTLRALLIGQTLSGAKAEAGKPVLVTSSAKGKDIFGAGSVLARMNTAFRENAATAEVWAIPVAEPESGTAASGTLTFTGTATGAGTVYTYIGSQRVAVDIAIDTTASEVAEKVAAAINSKSDLPVTAAASTADESGVVTVSAKNKGVLGNDILLQLNAAGVASGEELPEGIACAVVTLSGGTGTIDLSAISAAMGDESYDFIAVPYADAASLAIFTEIMNDKTGRWSPTNQLFGHVYSALRGTVEDLVSFGSGLNDQHLTVTGIAPATLSDSVEFLGAYVGATMTAIVNDPARPVQTLELVGVTGAPAGQRFTLSDRQTLLSNGIGTVYEQSGYVRIERAVTTYQTNAYGADDSSYFDSEMLHTLAYVIRKLKTRITSKYPRHKLADDGTKYGAGQAIVTPSVIRGELIAMYAELEEEGIVENADEFKKNLIVERNADNPNRLDVLLPPDLVNQLRIFATLVQFRLQY